MRTLLLAPASCVEVGLESIIVRGTHRALFNRKSELLTTLATFSSTMELQFDHNYATRSSSPIPSPIDLTMKNEVTDSNQSPPPESQLLLPSGDGKNYDGKVTVQLFDHEIWKHFCEINNEMVVSKSGRSMIPQIRFLVDGLEPRAMYSIALEFVQLDSHRWRYLNGGWVAGGKSEPPPARSQTLYTHPNSPNFGSHWMKEVVSFTKVQLTNKPTLQSGQVKQVVLNSLHKYQPKIHIIRIDLHANQSNSLLGLIESPKPTSGYDFPFGDHIFSFTFAETQFIAVTSYQNEDVSQLKIKYSRAFRNIRKNPTTGSSVTSAYTNSMTMSSMVSPPTPLSSSCHTPAKFSYNHHHGGRLKYIKNGPIATTSTTTATTTGSNVNDIVVSPSRSASSAVPAVAAAFAAKEAAASVAKAAAEAAETASHCYSLLSAAGHQHHECNNHSNHSPPPESQLLLPSGKNYDGKVSVQLLDHEIWKHFCEVNNEMVVSKSGRLMNPQIRFLVDGLEPSAMYSIALEFVQLGSHRWGYLNGVWVAGYKSAPPPARSQTLFTHPNSPNSGSHWMKEEVSFKIVKLMNKPTLQSGQEVVLNSLHKYQPKIHIIRIDSRANQSKSLLDLIDSPKPTSGNDFPFEDHIFSFTFAETQFIAVTSYQNEDVSQLKIKYNPFSRAFQNMRKKQTTGGSVTSAYTNPMTMSSILSPPTPLSSSCHTPANSSYNHHHGGRLNYIKNGPIATTSTTTTTTTGSNENDIVVSSPRSASSAVPPPPAVAAAFAAKEAAASVAKAAAEAAETASHCYSLLSAADHQHHEYDNDNAHKRNKRTYNFKNDEVEDGDDRNRL